MGKSWLEEAVAAETARCFGACPTAYAMNRENDARLRPPLGATASL